MVLVYITVGVRLMLSESFSPRAPSKVSPRFFPFSCAALARVHVSYVRTYVRTYVHFGYAAASRPACGALFSQFPPNHTITSQKVPILKQSPIGTYTAQYVCAPVTGCISYPSGKTFLFLFPKFQESQFLHDTHYLSFSKHTAILSYSNRLSCFW